MNIDISLLGFLLLAWFPFAVVCYTLREVPHIWSKSTTYTLRLKWMALSKWWIDASPRRDSYIRDTFGVNMFDDAYHFFGNLPRIALSLILIFAYHWLPGLITFFFWFVFREIIMNIIIEKNK